MLLFLSIWIHSEYGTYPKNWLFYHECWLCEQVQSREGEERLRQAEERAVAAQQAQKAAESGAKIRYINFFRGSVVGSADFTSTYLGSGII